MSGFFGVDNPSGSGSPGPTGPTGATGTSILTGTGAPAGGLGNIGDVYLNTANGDLYKKTGVSTWTLQSNITGPTGATGAPGANGTNGSQIYSAVGVPSPITGVDGDFYFNTANGDYYKKVAGSWVLQGNLQGPAGSPTLLNVDGGTPDANYGGLTIIDGGTP